jgi:hypothetical protein
MTLAGVIPVRVISRMTCLNPGRETEKISTKTTTFLLSFADSVMSIFEI